ncbi:MAG: transporter substrate-binding domain-containing protein [Pseudochelatococcus sp.]|jgi:polar amino acid transport system substrate-binding protein|uniref:transporter substrate-binding domain-containing protein n=1 Tax=Pseudochelatococcus sp. TaxID=2020869 RepID=UPI003D947D6E
MVSRRNFAAGIGLTALGAAAVAGSAKAADNAPGTFSRIRQSRKLRIAGIVGTEPYFHKDIATGEWSGFCVSMARDLAAAMEAEVEIIESTWGNSVLDLQANKIDIMFGLSPTPSRALTVEFTTPLMNNTFTIVSRQDFAPATWEALNTPDVRVAVDIGSTHDLFARRVLPKANLIALKTPDEAMLAVQSGRADCVIQVAMLSLVTVKKNPRLGTITVPTPIMQQPTSAGVRVDPDSRFLNYVNNWLEYNRALGTLRGWIISNLALVGVEEKDIPERIQF